MSGTAEVQPAAALNGSVEGRRRRRVVAAAHAALAAPIGTQREQTVLRGLWTKVRTRDSEGRGHANLCEVRECAQQPDGGVQKRAGDQACRGIADDRSASRRSGHASRQILALEVDVVNLPASATVAAVDRTHDEGTDDHKNACRDAHDEDLANRAA